MKKRMKVVFFGLAVLGLFMVAKTVTADILPICSINRVWYPSDKQAVVGNYCKCDGVYTNGWSMDCERKLFGSDCTIKKCDAVACCHEDIPNP